MKAFNNSLIFLFLILISIPIILPYFHRGYFPTHDGEWAVVRLSDMFRELKDFQIPPRFSGNLNFGYGYPLFNFAYPLPYYLGIILYLFKFGFVGSIKILFAISVPLSAIFMFYASKQLWKNKISALISAVLYIYLPYRMVDLYVRGSLGESLSFIFYPLIFYALIKISNNSKSKSFILLGSISYAFLIIAHNIMAILFSIIFILFLISQFFQKKNKIIIRLLIMFFFGVFMASFFWIPAIFEKQNILLSMVPIADRNLYFVNLSQFIFPSWGYGIPNQTGGFSYQLGLPHLILFTIVIFSLFFSILKKNLINNELFKNVLTLTLITLILIFFLFSTSAFFWELPLLKEINYPWTMLLPIGFLVSILSGYLYLQKRLIKFAVLILVFIAIIFFLPYAKPKYYVDREEGFYFTNDSTTTSSSELMPLWVKNYPSERFSKKVEFLEGEGKIKNIFFNSKKIIFEAELTTDSKIRINTIYYPGWKAKVNGEEVIINYLNKKGLMDLFIKKGNNTVELVFGETLLRLFADLITLVSLLIFIVFIFLSFNRKFIRI